jgi:regulation of enolase protein 1 (concanavalin A-like superfamily)
MRTQKVWLVVALGAGFLTSGVGRAQDVVNLLTNGGFEAADVTPWTAWGGATITLVQDLAGASTPQGPLQGGNCLHVVSAGSANYWDMGFGQRGLTFQQGKHYTVSAFLKCKKGTGQVNFKPELAADPWTGWEQSFVITEEWAEYHFTIPTVSQTLTPCEVVFHVGYAASDFWIDAVQLYEGDYVPTLLKPILTASRPSPGSGDVDVPRDPTLSWKPGPFASTHDVYFGSVFADVNTASPAAPPGVLASKGQAETTFTPAGLLGFGQTYYWRVDEVNAPPDNTVYPGSVWSFTTEPYSYPIKPIKATASSSQSSGMGPEKTIDGSGLDGLDQHGVSAGQMWLSKKGTSPIWIQYEFGSVVKLDQMWVWNSNQAVETITGFGAKDVTIQTSQDGITWTALPDVAEFSQATAEPNYVHNTTVGFGGVLAKFVKLTISTNWADGTKQAGLSEVRFFYVPVVARAPQPASGVTGVALDAVLNWRPGREAAKHDVLLSTDQAAVANGTAPAKTVSSHSLTLSSLGPEYGRTYYWKVNEVNDAATPTSWEGNVWSFTTLDYAVVDDFEKYDDACNRIFFSWVDGFGYSASPDCGVAASAGNATGSTVGNVNPPFAEKTIVHGGNKAMPMWFDNTKAPFYSETQREWPTGQAWTGGGANTLVVYLRGDAPGFLETAGGTILMNGTGTDVWDASDQFRFVYKSLKGNGSIIAKVESVSNANDWAKAGVMIRESVAGGSTHAFAAVTPTASHGISLQRRTETGVATNLATDVANTPTPQWVKVTRNGSTFTAQYSSDGKAWTDIATTDPVTITMANDVLIGLAVTSHDAAQVCGAKFSNVSTTGSVSGSWQVAEVGAAQVAGNTPETFYVALQDSSGKSKEVSHPDATVIATGNWEQWAIPLSQFTSGGVNAASIKKMTIGVGDPTSPKAGQSGKLYIDDIRLTRVATP